jgi:hypothetical protein
MGLKKEMPSISNVGCRVSGADILSTIVKIH